MLYHFGGRELNDVADYVIQEWDVIGLVIYKFVLVLFVILVCEQVGRMRRDVGLKLARAGVAIMCIPVAFAVVQMLFGDVF